jgi:serine/threonine protein kinase HipA of HipAB toxin-antitoxin module
MADEDRNLEDMRELFRRMMFNILIDNTDDHEKNHAVRVVAPTRQGRYRLAPAYDVLPTNSGQGYQEFIVGSEGRDSTRESGCAHRRRSLERSEEDVQSCAICQVEEGVAARAVRLRLHRHGAGVWHILMYMPERQEGSCSAKPKFS